MPLGFQLKAPCAWMSSWCPVPPPRGSVSASQEAGLQQTNRHIWFRRTCRLIIKQALQAALCKHAACGIRMITGLWMPVPPLHLLLQRWSGSLCEPTPQMPARPSGRSTAPQRWGVGCWGSVFEKQQAQCCSVDGSNSWRGCRHTYAFCLASIIAFMCPVLQAITFFPTISQQTYAYAFRATATATSTTDTDWPHLVSPYSPPLLFTVPTGRRAARLRPSFLLVLAASTQLTACAHGSRMLCLALTIPRPFAVHVQRMVGTPPSAAAPPPPPPHTPHLPPLLPPPAACPPQNPTTTPTHADPCSIPKPPIIKSIATSFVTSHSGVRLDVALQAVQTKGLSEGCPWLQAWPASSHWATRWAVSCRTSRTCPRVLRPTAFLTGTNAQPVAFDA